MIIPYVLVILVGAVFSRVAGKFKVIVGKYACIPYNFEPFGKHPSLITTEMFINRTRHQNPGSKWTTARRTSLQDDVDPYIVDYIPREKFILVTPFDEEFCQKIINKRFYEEHLKVKDCNLLDKSDTLIDGHILGKYNVTLLEKRKPLAWFEYRDIYIFFLRELNGPEGACDHNGYWARPLFNYQEDESLEFNDEVTATL
ncbi:hypothetical protein CRM22_008768 [Opisthorchis felineus]|uniref:Uncharacterized protein n=1 Tax=Opisthorchis felineus TaxID=147828 RepID=A0A4S2LHZ4_OPIFE|nr:hypothetical protein CRM22_008768 [Opisthorchis felineus]